MHNLVIYGGSFDPVHYGHLKTALAVQQALNFDRFLFLPCKTPLLKKTTMASSAQRLDMLALALQPYPRFAIDSQEIERDTPSYMVDTLQNIRRLGGQNLAITLLIGMDTFLQLPQWHAWQQLMDLSHLLVIHRPGAVEKASIAPVLQALLITRETHDKKELLTQPYGKIYRLDAGQYDISSTWLRQQINQGLSIENYVPAAVNQYIKEQALYR